MPPQLDDLRSRNVVTGTPAGDDLIPYYDVSELGNAAIKKASVSSISSATVTAASALTAMEAMTPTQGAASRTAIDSASLSDAQQLRYRSCATRMDVLNGNTVNATGVAQTITSTFTVKLTDAVRNLRILLTLGTGAANHTVKASAVVGSTIYKLYFNGARTAVVSADGMMLSDPLGPLFPKGTSVTFRVYADAGAGNVVQYNNANFTSGAGGYWTGVDNTDSASPGAVTGFNANIFNITAVVGHCENPCIAIIGDSTAYGLGPENAGWPVVAFGANTGNAPHSGLNANLLRLPKNGTLASNWTGSIEWKKQGLLQYADVALVVFGTNDLNLGATSAQCIASLQAIYNDLAARGLRVWGSTVPPISTSTDSWATTANQTAVHAVKIAEVNDWIRTLPSPLVGYVEMSDAASTARNSGIWKAAYTTDGFHPRTDTQGPREAIAAAVPADILTRYPA